MAKQKYYVVWEGNKKGVFDSWAECQQSIKGVKGARYKSFPSKKDAINAFRGEYRTYVGKQGVKSRGQQIGGLGSPVGHSITVDGAWNTATGYVEYQGVNTLTKEKIFHQGPFADGTNNLAEFLALVHALAFCQKKGLSLPIYSDSKTAMAWVRNKNIKSLHPRSDRNKELYALVDRGVKWINQNNFPNKILKWETKSWGENPADFGRK